MFVSTDMYLKVHQGPHLPSFNVVSNRKFQGHFKWCGQYEYKHLEEKTCVSRGNTGSSKLERKGQAEDPGWHLNDGEPRKLFLDLVSHL